MARKRLFMHLYIYLNKNDFYVKKEVQWPSEWHFRIFISLLEFDFVTVENEISKLALVSKNQHDLAVGALTYLHVLHNL